MDTAHLVTGATGFVGAALVLELLQQTDVHVVCVVRGPEPQARLRATLRQAAQSYGQPESLLSLIETRCHAVSGDVQQSGCGINSLPRFHYDQLWHSAASLRFEDRYADEIFAINVQGTQHVLALAHRLGIRHFNYMSTAYVVGALEGVLPEASVPVDVTHNVYEKSKLLAERLVEGTPGLGKRIFRPSIVIGHSRTRAATNFTGMYGFLRKLYAFRGMMARAQAELLQHKSLAIKGDSDVTLNFVPIDCVVSDAVAVMKGSCPAPGENTWYHLTNPSPPLVGEVISLMFQSLNLSVPRWVTSMEGLEWLDEKFNERTDFYRTYFFGEKQFDRSRTNQFVPVQPEPYAMPEPTLRDYYRWYLERLDAERQSLPSSR